MKASNFIQVKMTAENEIIQKSKRFLVALYLIVNKNVGQEIETEKIFDTIGISFDGQGNILRCLADNRWVGWTNHRLISVTHKGQIEAEKIMETTYAERESKVLRAIYEMANRQPLAMIIIDDLAKAVEMPFQELNPILIDLEKRKNLIGSIEEAVWMLPAGIEFLESQDVLTSNMKDTENQADPKKVFVVHGRNEALRRSMFNFLRAVGLEPIEWSEAIRLTGKGSPYVGDVLDTAFSVAQAIVVLMTPDDEARLREEYRGDKEPAFETELTGQPRQNVLIEAGMALGRNPDRTILVEIGQLRPISDLIGRHTVRLDNSVAKRQDIVDRLETAECAVNIKGKRDWHSVGNFELELVPKAKIENQKSKDEVDSSIRPELDKEAVEVLVAVSKYDECIIEALEEDLKKQRTVLKFYLHELIEQEYIESYRSFNDFTMYLLTQKGRRYVVKNGLI